MPSLFPLILDVFVNPTSSTTLDASGSNPALRHHLQHANINDAMAALQSRVGTTGSLISTTIDYELHNVEHGHNHDGINSRPVALGTSGSISFNDGLFPFTVFTTAGDAISQINKALLDLSQSFATSSLTTQYNDVVLTNQTQVINLSGSIVSASLTSGTEVTYAFDALQEESRALIILADAGGGPFEKYLSGSFREITYVNNVFPSTKIWYEDSSKAKKIIEKFITYNSNKTPSMVVWSVYEPDGATVRTTATDIITYVTGGVIEATRTRTIA